MIKQTVAEVRTNEKFILLEGMFNNTKFKDDNDKLAQRLVLSPRIPLTSLTSSLDSRMSFS